MDRNVIYSLGSNDQFDFVDSMIAATKCEIHTFDCTSRPPSHNIENHKFHSQY